MLAVCRQILKHDFRRSEDTGVSGVLSPPAAQHQLNAKFLSFDCTVRIQTFRRSELQYLQALVVFSDKRDKMHQ